MEKKIIVSCLIEEGKYTNKVHATFDDGSETMIFEYYWDEISFTESEFIGLTEDEAYNLFHKKDVEYLRN